MRRSGSSSFLFFLQVLCYLAIWLGRSTSIFSSRIHPVSLGVSSIPGLNHLELLGISRFHRECNASPVSVFVSIHSPRRLLIVGYLSSVDLNVRINCSPIVIPVAFFSFIPVNGCRTSNDIDVVDYGCCAVDSSDKFLFRPIKSILVSFSFFFLRNRLSILLNV